MPLPFSSRRQYPSPGQAAQPKDRVCHQTHTLQEGAAGARLRLKQFMAQATKVWVSRPASPGDSGGGGARCSAGAFTLVELMLVIAVIDRKSTRLNSSHLVISYAVFCLKK